MVRAVPNHQLSLFSSLLLEVAIDGTAKFNGFVVLEFGSFGQIIGSHLRRWIRLLWVVKRQNFVLVRITVSEELVLLSNLTWMLKLVSEK